MVITTITSGLGNQLFQYAIGKHLAAKNQTSLYFDKRFYGSEYAAQSQRGFKLDNFNIKYKELSKPLEYTLKIAKLLPNGTLNPLISTVKEDAYHFNPAVLNARASIVRLVGYWQSELYFKERSADIRRELAFTNSSGPKFNMYKSMVCSAVVPVSLHVRRGDYVTHPEFSQTFGFVGLDYYIRAIEMLVAWFPNCTFFIFTDDPLWVQNNLITNNEHFIVQNEGDKADVDDLHLMSLCSHHIIANSSFSWWGAWLNDNDAKKVIAPKRWYKNQPNWNTKDLLPNTWLTL